MNQKDVTIMLFTVILLICLFSCTSSDDNAVKQRSIDSHVTGLIEDVDQDNVKLERIFYFVRDDIEFNWVYPQDIPPEKVLNNGYGVCMQKANLFAAMVESAGFETRFHFVFVRKQALEDFLPAFAYEKWLDPFPHTVVEVKLGGHWVSFDPSFDKDLHDLCVSKDLNFGKYPEIRSLLSIDFSVEGVKGAQQFWEVEDREGFYGTDLTPLMEFERENVSFWKRMLKPMIFRKAHTIMDEIREPS